jgi:hypothetical protein
MEKTDTYMEKTVSYGKDGQLCKRGAVMEKTGSYGKDGHFNMADGHLSYGKDGHSFEL